MSAEPPAPYKIATISRLTTFSPQRLRAWERRYDLLRPERGPGGHRLYGLDDLRVLREVRRLLEGGRSIGEINDIGRDALLGRVPSPHPTSTQVESWVRGIVNAAQSMDDRTIHRILDDAFASLPNEEAIDRVVGETQRRLGRLWARGRCTIASEHMATGIFVFRVRSLVEAASSEHAPGAARILCACLPGERHELGLLTIGYSLAVRGHHVTTLGADVPFPDLEKACATLAPRATLLSVSSRKLLRTNETELLDYRRRIGASTAVVLGGRGAANQDAERLGSAVTVMPPGGSPSDTARSLLRALGLPEAVAEVAS